MDPVTHTLTGALIGQAGLKRRTGLAMPALLVGANLPDIDVACFLWLDGVEHLAFRRGVTHGPIAWVLLPLLLAGALWWFDHWQARRGTRPEGRLPVHFGWLYGLSFLACLTHPALDWLNVYGVRLLEPFSSRWYYGDVLFIIDVWLWAIMGIGLCLSLRREGRGQKWRWPAVTAIVLSFVYIANSLAESVWQPILYTINEKVIPNKSNGFERPPRYELSTMIASPPPIYFWQREIILGERNKWRVVPAGRSPAPRNAAPITDRPCAWPSDSEFAAGGSETSAFLFWSRAPFAERAPDGSVLIRDARYYDPRARNRFSVALPNVECKPPSLE